MLKSAFDSIRKEFLLMFKQKTILFVMIIIPVLVNFLLGFVLYSNQIRNIPMAVVDQDNSSLSRTIVQQFRENEIFNIKYDIHDSDELKKLLDDSKVRVGMVIPKDFSKDVTGLRSPTILMLYDGSHLSIASAAKSRATEILMTLKTGILIKLLEGKMNLPADAARKMALDISFSSRTLYNPVKSFKNFLMPGLGTAIAQSGIALMSAVAIRDEEVKTKKRERLGHLIGKIVFYGTTGTVSLVLCILIQTQIFGVPFRGNMWNVFLLSLSFAVAVASFSIMVSSWIRNEMISTIVNAVIFIPNTIMVGYTWPVMAMPAIYRAAAAFFPFTHYADNIRDMCLKGSTPSPVIFDIDWMLKFTAVAFAIAFAGVLRLKAARNEKEEGPMVCKLKFTSGKFTGKEEGELQ